MRHVFPHGTDSPRHSDRSCTKDFLEVRPANRWISVTQTLDCGLRLDGFSFSLSTVLGVPSQKYPTLRVVRSRHFGRHLSLLLQLRSTLSEHRVPRQATYFCFFFKTSEEFSCCACVSASRRSSAMRKHPLRPLDSGAAISGGSEAPFDEQVQSFARDSALQQNTTGAVQNVSTGYGSEVCRE